MSGPPDGGRPLEKQGAEAVAQARPRRCRPAGVRGIRRLRTVNIGNSTRRLLNDQHHSIVALVTSAIVPEHASVGSSRSQPHPRDDSHTRSGGRTGGGNY
ncbi:hypothetical protein SDC9_121686 [bioreactor metagenome]|uniref:Uncharacterized protein n=1 Tax=bioreactor metagenome TaxID=1076179 RepID=A0A645CCM9_9ZZZZ